MRLHPFTPSPSRPVALSSECMPLKRKDLLGIADLSPEEINLILDTAETFRDVNQRQIKKVPTLRGKTVINLFFEASTRTRTSFEIAAKRLSAAAINISASTPSVVKGETLIDTASLVRARARSGLVFRQGAAGAPVEMARLAGEAVTMGGAGGRELPTQGLRAGGPIRHNKGRLSGLKV